MKFLSFYITSNCTLLECRVEYDYTAQEDDELTLKKGDIISNVIQKMDGWWEGSLRGKKGMFPDNFVKLIEKSNQPTPPKMETPKSDSNSSNNSNGVTLRNSTKSTRRLKALFSYAAEQEDELKLEMGDVIDFMQEVEEGWWMGKLKGRVGIFPSNFVTDYEPSSNGKIENTRKLSDVNKPSSVKEEVFAIATDVVPAPPTSEPPPLDEEPAPVLPPKPVRELARCFYPYQAQNEDELTLNEGDVVTIISKNCEDEGWWRGEMKGKTGLFPDNFVKIIPANESTVQVKRTASSASTTAAAKISPQERNLKGVIPISPTETSEPTLERKFSNTTVVDGVSSSKVQDKEARMSKVEATKAMFSKPFSFATGPKPPTPTSPSSGMSPMSMPVGLRRSNSNNKKDDDPSDEMGDFNSIEKGEKLNHLTASRAKPPKRRPPSTLIPRDNETSLTNGNHDSMDSPPMNSTPFNSTFNSSASMNGTPSASIIETSSVSSSGGSFLSAQSKDGPSPVSGNTNGGAVKPKKLVSLPWMAELKQTQDKKKQTQGSPLSATPNSSVVNNMNTSGLAPSPSSLPTVSPSPHIPTKEPTPPPVVPAKAPPLPAKPSTLNTSSILTGSVDKSSTVSPSSATAPSIVHRGFGKKPPGSPMQPTSPVNNQFSTGYSMDNTGSGDSKGTVSYEDYAILKDRVVHLEAELDTIKRQLKLLMDRDMSHGHIV